MGAASCRGPRIVGGDRASYLSGVRSGRIKGKAAALPKGWALVKGFLPGPHANLTAATLRTADLRRANLTGVTLTKADLPGARLASRRYTHIKGRPKALPRGWKIVGGTLKR